MITSVAEQQVEKLNGSASPEISPAHLALAEKENENDPKVMARVDRLLKAVLDADLQMVRLWYRNYGEIFNVD